MIAIIGLGNPGKKFKENRHNVGFLVIDEILKNPDCLVIEQKNKFEAEVIIATINDQKIILAKPQTFMNNSGKAVKKILNYYKIPLNKLWVIHDEIDLPLGTIRISKNISSAGHKGIESIINELKSRNFFRFRIGIGPKNNPREPAELYVLQDFSKEQKPIIKKVITKTAEIIINDLKHGPKKETIELQKKD